MINAHNILVVKPEGKRPFRRPRHTEKYYNGSWVRGWRLDASDSGQASVAGCCEHGNEPLGSIKGGELHTQMSD
jgi:hypothetical protein